MYYDTQIIENVDVFFKEYEPAKRKTLKDLRGRIQFRDDYNYKSMRAGV